MAQVEIFNDSVWQMSLGERAAFEGVLSQLKPPLAVEIGTAEGGSLARIAAQSGEVHSFDLVEPQIPIDELGNVTLHTGDSHALLPEVLAGFAAEGRNVDFVLVDGDHSPEGVRRDLEDLLNSPALSQTVIVVHDINNERVRSGVDAVPYTAWPKVAHVDLDWVPGYVFKQPELLHELWGGLGLVVVDASRLAYFPGTSVVQDRYYPAHPVFVEMRDRIAARERAEAEGHMLVDDESLKTLAERVEELEAELTRVESVSEHHRRLWNDLMGSWSWKVTAPLRRAKDSVRGVIG